MTEKQGIRGKTIHGKENLKKVYIGWYAKHLFYFKFIVRIIHYLEKDRYMYISFAEFIFGHEIHIHFLKNPCFMYSLFGGLIGCLRKDYTGIKLLLKSVYFYATRRGGIR